MRAILTAFIVALWSTAAVAQQRPALGFPVGGAPEKKERYDGGAYREALDKIPNRPAPDPWGNMRATPPAKGAQKKDQKK